MTSEELVTKLHSIDCTVDDDALFKATWAKIEEAGYFYSDNNISNVHFGWLLAKIVLGEEK